MADRSGPVCRLKQEASSRADFRVAGVAAHFTEPHDADVSGGGASQPMSNTGEIIAIDERRPADPELASIFEAGAAPPRPSARPVDGGRGSRHPGGGRC